MEAEWLDLSSEGSKTGPRNDSKGYFQPYKAYFRAIKGLERFIQVFTQFCM